MAITRSKNVPEKPSGKPSESPDTELEPKVENPNKSFKAKTFVKNSTKPGKVVKLKSGNKISLKTNNTVNKPKNITNTDVIPNPKETINTLPNSEIFKAANVEIKGRKLPPYKVEQLQRLQDLICMSSVAKPRGPITFQDNISRDLIRNQEGDSLKIIDKSNKDKISNITNYDPIRQDFLNDRLSEGEIAELEEKYQKIRKYQNIKAPQLSDDLYLQEVLTEIVERDYGLKFWEYFTNQSDAEIELESFGNQKLFENERDLQLLEISVAQRKKILNKNNENFNNVNDKKNNMDKKYSKINIDEMVSNTELGKMLKDVTKSRSTSPENEENAFKGLKTSDFTTIRKFDQNKI